MHPNPALATPGIEATFVTATRLPTPWGAFVLHGFKAGPCEHLALTYGHVSDGEPVLTRIHSECLTGDALFSQRCDCGSQLEAAMSKIAGEGRGALLYLRQEGRGIGLINKLRAYALQDVGLDTVEANQQLGFAADEREYGVCKSMLDHLRITQVRLMTNNPRKLEALVRLGVEVTERIPLRVGACTSNAQYLATKSQRLGHLLT